MAKLLRHFGLGGGKKAPPSQQQQQQQSRQDFFSQGFQPKAQGTDRISGILGEPSLRDDLGGVRRSDCPTTRSLPLSVETRAETDAQGPRCPPPSSDSPGQSSPAEGLSPVSSSPGGPCLLQESVSSAPTLRAELIDNRERASASGCQDTEKDDDKELEILAIGGIDHHPEEDYPLPYELKDLTVAEVSAKPKYYDPYANPDTMSSASAHSTLAAGDFGHYRNLPVITAMMQNSYPGGSGEQTSLDVGENVPTKPSPDVDKDDDDDDDDDDVENYMDLQEEEIGIPRIGGGIEHVEGETWRTASPSLRAACIDAGLNNYDEPWDLANTRRELEERLQFMQRADPPGQRADPLGQRADPSGQRSSERQSQLFDGGADDRPQEGYDKPWDLQPHMKDDRGQEGYDKPWDLKPHQKDLRPAMEYDVPWDNKVKNIERDLIAAKRAKDTTKCDGMPMTSAMPSAGPQARPDVSKVADTRPGCDYDEPWDQKKKQLVNKVSDQGAKAAHSPAPGSQFPQSASRSSGVWAKTIGERIDPKVPLELQAWYHGSISRIDAENLLRVHREGSYLVRTSESNLDDYSLSVKSIRGFMHMKIVKNSDSRYILGQFSQPFVSIPQMIYHYTVNKLPIKGADHMSLMYPINNELL